MGYLPKDSNGNVIHQALSPINPKSVAMTVTTAATAADFTENVIRVVATSDCFIKLGTTGVTAALTDHFLPAGKSEVFSLLSNGTRMTRIAAIVSTGTGTLYVSEMV